ncbi:hypothetical protein HmCmsJML041_03612 [Escherichia coli]|nr:hypothetical protein HmCmsJML041_03612 [Escherichia coli]
MKNEIWSLIGDPLQVARINHYELRTCQAKGTESFNVVSGVGVGVAVGKK